MKLVYRKILLFSILILMILLYCWMDELYMKQVGYFDYKYELVKIILHSTIAYKLTKYIIKKLQLNIKLQSQNPVKIFTVVFLICNSYIITQYLFRSASNQIINKQIRKKLNSRTIKLGPTGWGYECDSLDYLEYKELTKLANIIDLPTIANSIFVHDWYEFDFRRIVEFEVPKEFRAYEYFKNDTIILNNLSKIKYGAYSMRTIYNDKFEKEYYTKQIKYDTLLFARYKYEISEY